MLFYSREDSGLMDDSVPGFNLSENNLFDIPELTLHALSGEESFIHDMLMNSEFVDSKKNTLGTTASRRPDNNPYIHAYQNRVYRSSVLEGGTFEVGQHVVYPTHGLGKLVAKVSDTIAGHYIECYKIEFPEKSITVLVPLNKIKNVNLRRLVSKDDMESVYAIMKEPAKGLRVIWNRRAKEYESKIQSGCLFENAEVVRDLYRNINNPNKSYTESIIYDEAFIRVSSELSIVLDLPYKEVEDKINDILDKYHETFQSLADLASEDARMLDDDDDDEEEEEEADDEYESLDDEEDAA